MDEGHQDEAQRRGLRVVLDHQVLVLDDVADHDWRGVPSRAALMKSPQAGMKVSSEPARCRAARARRDLAEGGRAARVEVGRRLDQALVDLLQRHVQRQRKAGSCR